MHVSRKHACGTWCDIRLSRNQNKLTLFLIIPFWSLWAVPFIWCDSISYFRGDGIRTDNSHKLYGIPNQWAFLKSRHSFYHFQQTSANFLSQTTSRGTWYAVYFIHGYYCCGENINALSQFYMYFFQMNERRP